MEEKRFGKNDLDRAIEYGNSVVFFYTRWCTACMLQKPIIDKWMNVLPDRIRVFEIDIDDNPLPANEMDVRSVPMFVFFRGGGIIYRLTGLQSFQGLKDAGARIYKTHESVKRLPALAKD